MVKTAAVTGATGMIGSKIVSLLLEQNYKVKVLSRNKSFVDPRVEVIYGSLANMPEIEELLVDISLMFHCAAELNNEEKMWETNVVGTQNLIKALSNKPIEYFCHMSSVGVIGKFDGMLADETTKCNPLNLYEKSKLEAEKIINNYSGPARVIILRPTNVINKIKNNLKGLSKLALFFKGGENAHIVHSDDVASVAMYFIQNHSGKNPDCYIVSCDQEKRNTFAGCYSIYLSILVSKKEKYTWHLHWIVPYLIRRMTKGICNKGNIQYSSAKLLATGFTYPLGLRGAIEKICS